jgi:hypothetical protein
MELDEFKEQWKKKDSAPTIENKNIMEMIRQNSNGPVAALKQSYRRQIGVMLVLPIVLILTNIPQIESALTSVLFWVYTLFCVSVAIFARMNYRIVETLEERDGMVKSHLEKTIETLETRMRQNVKGVKITLLLFVVLTEVLPYFQHFRMLDAWHALSPFIRFGTYALLILLQHFSVRRMSYLKFGKHIERLKKLVGQMQ